MKKTLLISAILLLLNIFFTLSAQEVIINFGEIISSEDGFLPYFKYQESLPNPASKLFIFEDEIYILHPSLPKIRIFSLNGKYKRSIELNFHPIDFYMHDDMIYYFSYSLQQIGIYKTSDNATSISKYSGEEPWPCPERMFIFEGQIYLGSLNSLFLVELYTGEETFTLIKTSSKEVFKDLDPGKNFTVNPGYITEIEILSNALNLKINDLWNKGETLKANIGKDWKYIPFHKNIFIYDDNIYHLQNTDDNVKLLRWSFDEK